MARENYLNHLENKIPICILCDRQCTCHPKEPQPKSKWDKVAWWAYISAMGSQTRSATVELHWDSVRCSNWQVTRGVVTRLSTSRHLTWLTLLVLSKIDFLGSRPILLWLGSCLPTRLACSPMFFRNARQELRARLYEITSSSCTCDIHKASQ